MENKQISSSVIGYKLKFRQKLYLAIKSFIDFLVAITAIAILLPVFLITALAIKIDSKGPVFFVQKRIGKNGKLFNCVKFRSMAKEAKPNVATASFNEAEHYITKVGRFIRKFSIDELPQLFNVLTFKMCIIGFRPIIPQEEELHEARVKYSVYDIKPGITGWAQINGRDLIGDQPVYKAQLDNFYKNHVSFFFDVKIFFLTIYKVLHGSDVKDGLIDVVPAETNVVIPESASGEVGSAVKSLSKDETEQSV